MAKENPGKKDFEKIFADEGELIRKKREKYHPEDSKGPSFGIALSGGGIRSATVNLGVLEVLNNCGILSRADYLSSVSGGGYIASYVHARLKQGGPEAYQELFTENEINTLRDYGYYLTPGKSLLREKLWSYLRLAGAVAGSFLLNLVWVVALFGTLLFFLKCLPLFDCVVFWRCVVYGVGLLALGVLAWHFFLHGLRHFKLWPTDLLYLGEGILLAVGVFLGSIYLAHKIPGSEGWGLFICFVILFLAGLFANPNLISMHRFYRDRLAGAFLRAAGKGDRGLKLAELRPEAGAAWAPYPLINTCLNLFSLKDKIDKNNKKDKIDNKYKDFKGARSTDYFLLSPLYCGSKLTGYVDTQVPGYKNMTLSTAVAVSGAAVNPHMGERSNRLLTFFMSLFNLRLGYWALNPKIIIFWLWRYIAWWPYYLILELLSMKGTIRRRVNLSDGGHIENLAVYELLRRGCKLIIAVDAGADPNYAFADLKNLVIRARNELGLAIDFRPDPETDIRPLPSRGFSRSQYVTATITDLPGKKPGEELYDTPGLLIYLKSSMLPPGKVIDIDSASYDYKTYHPAFPHESTADQFFDHDQWGAYYNLGRFMAGDLLGIYHINDITDWKPYQRKSIEDFLKKLPSPDEGMKKEGSEA